MTLIVIETMIGAVLAGSLCGSLGVYLDRMNLLTLGFVIAHAALAGAALSIIFRLNTELLAFVTSLITVSFIELVCAKFNVKRDLIAMSLFALTSSLGMLAIYFAPTTTLTAQTASLILWGSILAMTIGKIILLTLIMIALVIYIMAFKVQINAILFDRKLAEAEGVKVTLHATIFILITTLTVSLILRLTGSFLVFSLIYNSAMAASQISRKKQAIVGGALGALAGVIGVIISFKADTPIGATIALISSIILFTTLALAAIRDIKKRKRIISIQLTVSSNHQK